jgi:hypothetical protein
MSGRDAAVIAVSEAEKKAESSRSTKVINIISIIGGWSIAT